MKKVVFVFNSLNNIYVNLFNGMTQYADLEIHVVVKQETVNFDKLNKKIHIHKMNNYDVLAKLIYLPNSLLRFFSKKHNQIYNELSSSPYYLNLKNKLNEINPDVIISNICFYPITWQSAIYSKKIIRNLCFLLKFKDILLDFLIIFL
jgi:hypothetical protein